MSAFSGVPFPSRGKKLDEEIFAKILPIYLAKPFDFSKPNYLGSRALFLNGLLFLLLNYNRIFQNFNSCGYNYHQNQNAS